MFPLCMLEMFLCLQCGWICTAFHVVEMVNLQVEFGKSAILPCNGSSYLEEEGSVQWEAMGEDVAVLRGAEPRQGDRFKGRVQLPTEQKLLEGDWSVVLQHAVFSDSDMYECILQGRKTISTVWLTVTAPNTERSLVLSAGDTVDLTCYIQISRGQSMNDLQVWWTRNGNTIVSTQKATFPDVVVFNPGETSRIDLLGDTEGEFHLYMSPTMMSDSGEYNCLYKTSSFLPHRTMEEMREESLVFSVRVFSLQEETPEEESVEAHEELLMEQVQVQQQISRQAAEQELTLLLTTGQEVQRLTVQDANRALVFQFTVSKETDCCQVGGQSFLVTAGVQSFLLRFNTPADMKNFQQILRRGNDGVGSKVCTEREERENREADGGQTPLRRQPTTSDTTADRFQFHSCLSQQQNLLQDFLRITTYQRAILINESDFRDKVVLDVCCGSGILSFFAVQAGATRVYAVDSSPTAEFTQILVQSNCLSERIRVLQGDVDEVSCPDMVDVIVSEPMGYMLLNDRLMENFLHARKWLKPNGLMFPSCGDIHLAPFSDEQLYFEHYARATFWQQRSFYGVDLSALHSPAVDEFFKQPIVDAFDVQILMARSVKHCINFMEVKEEDLLRMEIPFVFTLLQSGLVHGLAFWFDVAYLGSKSAVWLSTAPSEPLTRWFQVRCLLQTPLFAKLGQTLSGTVLLAANSRQSYDIHITATVDQSGFRSGNILDLKNPFFRTPSWFHS